MDNIYEILIKSSSPYLIAKKGEWITSEGIILIKNMRKEHIIRSYKMMKREERTIKMGCHLDGIDRYFSELKNEKTKQSIIEECCVLFDEKLHELEMYIQQNNLLE